ncbi:protein kinase family protein [Rhynchospora pubera]|uniref:Protein kinase family protein n=1 Tax=Rhynchospora pubera TaxID=906938 RepID=A0AAV8EJ74_9POAL|nr:protein kinase family protein [Rhynchospora pubera]
MKKGSSELENEVSILSRLRHKFIVGYWRCSKAKWTIDILYEYIHGSSIRNMYVENRFDKNKILKALRYLHKNNVVHRDLSCSNILLDDKGVVKVVGFHFAQEIEGEKEIGEWIRWAAPEILIPKESIVGRSAIFGA